MSESDNVRVRIILERKMDPSYIYFKEINIDQDKSFTADLKKKTK